MATTLEQRVRELESDVERTEAKLSALLNYMEALAGPAGLPAPDRRPCLRVLHGGVR